VHRKLSARRKSGYNPVILDDEAAEFFPTEEAVDEALRLITQLTRLPGTEKATIIKP